jgi:glucose/arabinose dehydrogenase
MKSWRIIFLIAIAVAGVSAALVAQQNQPQLGEPTPAKPNPGRVVPKPDDAQLKVPAGFTVDMYADNVPGARIMTYAPNGDLFVTQTGQNAVMVFRDTNKDGLPDERFTYAQGPEPAAAEAARPQLPDRCRSRSD